MVLQKISKNIQAFFFFYKFMQFKTVWRFVSTELKQTTKVSKIRYYKASIFSWLNSRLVFTCLFCFLLGFGADTSLEFAFPSNLSQVQFRCFTYLLLDTLQIHNAFYTTITKAGSKSINNHTSPLNLEKRPAAKKCRRICKL